MKHTLVTLAVLVALVGLGALAYRLLKPRNGDLGGPRNWMKDLEGRQAAADYFEARQSLDELDGRYYSCEENIDALLAQYALAHKEHFAAQ